MSGVALITGANGAIGKALCASFSSSGYSVIATDRQVSSDLEIDQYIELDLKGLRTQSSHVPSLV